MLRNKAYKFRLYPNNEQEILINKTFGCARYVYNYFLTEWKRQYQESGESLGYNKCSKMLTQLKKELTWLKEVDSSALQDSLKNLEKAYKNFFKKNSNYPKFKSKKDKAKSYTSKLNENILIEGNKIRMPKLGWIKVAKSREVTGRILNATIRKTSSCKYYVSVLVEEDIIYMNKTNTKVGIDLGLKDFAILSNGTIYKNPKIFRKLEKKLAFENRKLSRKKRGSANHEKQRIKVAKVYEKIANTKKDYLQKVSTEIVKNHDIICMEDLKVSNLLKNRNLAKAISEVSWHEFRTMLEYKCEWYGKELVVIGKTFPSSQLCHECKYRWKGTKDLKVREWTCPNCGHTHDRDLNASKNILDEGLRLVVG